MRLVRESAGRRFEIVDDAFVHVEDDAALPEGDAIVSWARWGREREVLSARAGRLGVRLPSDARVAEVAADAARFAVIAIEFPKFVDGRGYSIARLLRERYAYRGELRAVGNVLRDQLQAMARCGFDAFEIDPGKRIEDVLSAFADFTVLYQPAADERLPLWKRHARPWPGSARQDGDGSS
jgi:uncharacterized protein (DUF934 family)